MSEQTIAIALRTLLQSMSNFADADVTICDWSVLDGSSTAAPYAIIDVADSFETQFQVSVEEARWDIPVEIYEAFSDWDTTRAAFRDTRQAVIDQLADSPGATLGLACRAVRSESPVAPVYPAYLSDNERAEALPVFLMQRIIVVCEEF